MSMYIKYQRITTQKQLTAITPKLKDRTPIALDLETTALSPKDGKVRTVNLCNEDLHCVIDCSKIKGGFKAVAEMLMDRELMVFMLTFEGAWLQDAGINPMMVDVGHMRRSVMGGGPLSLKMQAKFDLDITVNKEEQASDWSAKKLTDEQWDYAFADASVTWELAKHWNDKMSAGHWRALRLFNNMWEAVNEMSDNGILLDVDKHHKLVQQWFSERLVAENSLKKRLPEEQINLQSDNHLSDYFSLILPDTFLAGWPRTEKTGQLSMKNESLRHMAAYIPGTELANALLDLVEYKYLGKYLSSFGESLINTANRSEGGRIRARFNVGAARTGRMSSSGPNVQQIPRGNHVRESFVAGPKKVLASYDYNGIEMRCIAELSGDKQLLKDVIYGDVHLAVASQIAGRKLSRKKDAELRQAAKAVNFGIIYGSGASGLAATTRKSEVEAKAMIEAWAARYPAAYAMRYQWEKDARRTGYLTTQSGGTIWVGKKASLPVCANYPVQRAAAEVMYAACARHKASLDIKRKGKTWASVKLLATIHDCLIDECATSMAKPVLRLMKQDMVAGFLDVFPDANSENLVEGGSGPSWGDLS